MSTDYEIRCCECGASVVEDCRSPKYLSVLLTMRDELAAVYEKGSKHPDYEALWMVPGWDSIGSMFPYIFKFFSEHRSHTLAVFDEYGDKWVPE